jgi:hypothetical protein
MRVVPTCLPILVVACAILVVACATGATPDDRLNNQSTVDARPQQPQPDSGSMPRPDASSSGGTGGGGDSGTPASCGPVTEEGSCVGSQLSYCEAGMLEMADCSSFGLMCQCDDAGYCDCVGAGGTTPDAGVGGGGGDCGAVTEGGRCAGAQLAYCESGMLVEVDCAGFGLTCQCDGTGFCDCL